MNYNFRDLSIIILLVLLILLINNLNRYEHFYFRRFPNTRALRGTGNKINNNQRQSQTLINQSQIDVPKKLVIVEPEPISDCPVKKKNLGIFNTDNDSRTSSYVEKSDSLTHGKLFDFFERDPHGNLDYSENKILVKPTTTTTTTSNKDLIQKLKDLIQNLKDCKNVCVLFYSSKTQQFDLDFTNDILGGDGDSIKKHFGNFSNPNNLSQYKTINNILNKNVCTSDEEVITDATKFKYFGGTLFNNKTPDNVIDIFKKGVYNDDIPLVAPTVFKVVDCNQNNNKNFCFNNGIKKYPTLKFYQKVEYCTKDNLGEEKNEKLRVRRQGLSEFREMGSYNSNDFSSDNIKKLLKKYLFNEEDI